MLTTIEIIHEPHPKKKAIYRAIHGDQQASGKTAGQALDSLEELLAATTQQEKEGTIVILQRFRPDEFFSSQQQNRMQALMNRFHDALAVDESLSDEERQELEHLISQEWQAAIARAASFLGQTDQSTH
ncbi:MAG: hypothetical protein HND44_11050 [Chloroflexi bacterium]|nr:hypothetical protein [Ardenticatenaceae bacterium]MBL1129016.1 hypothetical protein [Chloroflexota bacterium]NOG35095.1 hypothetical protein [Chloroflexota bacterium]GIK59069.1 MAG: hypothetical protein BroJett015_47320 [Chloroflexota bacterium]